MRNETLTNISRFLAGSSSWASAIAILPSRAAASLSAWSRTSLSQKASVGLVTIIFAIYAFSSFIGTWKGITPNIFLGGDSSMIASVAMASVHPELFERDFLFSSAQNYAFYSNFSVWFLQLIVRFTDFDLGSAYYALIVPAQFFHLLGYFLLGRRVLGSVIAAFAFSIACSIMVATFYGDYWGFHREPQPRLIYAAALPFLFLLAMGSGNSLGRWMTTFAVAGAATYLHPASGPPVSLAIMGGMIFAAWPTTSLGRLAVLVLTSGMLYLAIFLPFAITYLTSVLNAGQDVAPSAAMEATRLRIREQYLDLGSGLVSAFSNTWYNLRGLILLLALAGAWVVYRYSKRERTHLTFFAGFVIVLAFASCAIPLAGQALAALRGGYVVELDVVRSIRYFIPIVLLFALWGLLRLPLRIRGTTSVLAIVFAAFWIFAQSSGVHYEQRNSAFRAWTCWTQGRFYCDRSKTERDLLALLTHVRNNVPPSSTFVSPNFALVVRYYARLPVAFAYKDFSFVSYSNHRKLVDNIHHVKQYKEIMSITDREQQATALAKFATAVGAEYLLLYGPLSPNFVATLGRVDFLNDRGALIRLM